MRPVCGAHSSGYPNDTKNIRGETLKLPHKYTAIAFAAYMAGIIAFVMSAVLTAMNSGMSDGYLSRTLSAYVVALPVAFISVVVFRPLILLMVSRTVQGPSTTAVNEEGGHG